MRTDYAAKGVGSKDVPAFGRGCLAALLAVAGTFVLLWLLSPGLRSDLGQLAELLGEIDAAGIRVWVLSFGAFSPVVYFLVMVGQVIASPVPAGPVTLAGALLFGVWEGLALSMAGSVVGATIVFLAVRQWGTSLVIRLVGQEMYHKYVGKLDDKGLYLFIILLVPFMPDDAACVLAGLSAISFRRFLVIVVVGGLPETTLMVVPASEISGGFTVAWISTGLVAVSVLTLGFVYRERLVRDVVWCKERSGRVCKPRASVSRVPTRRGSLTRATNPGEYTLTTRRTNADQRVRTVEE